MKFRHAELKKKNSNLTIDLQSQVLSAPGPNCLKIRRSLCGDRECSDVSGYEGDTYRLMGVDKNQLRIWTPLTEHPTVHTS